MALRFSADVSTAETAYGTVLLDEHSGEYWELNPTATLIVQALLDGGDETAAVEALTAAFDISRDQALDDVTQLLQELRTAGLAA